MTARLSPIVALGLPCYNRPAAFVDSEHPRVREEAASQCLKYCTQLEWCEQQRLETVQVHGSAVGVWAGNVWTHDDYKNEGSKGRAA